ncbi:hypothetical protein CGZ80_15610 [Rhodopirellula sp. MGV]|nr:hypothetical protein CGZ80_15610 [Rhodopirellula sp. MGV]PNY35043.1 hypothetical protein C2E31_20250 [Rhodopirellula baltica]
MRNADISLRFLRCFTACLVSRDQTVAALFSRLRIRDRSLSREKVSTEFTRCSARGKHRIGRGENSLNSFDEPLLFFSFSRHERSCSVPQTL